VLQVLVEQGFSIHPICTIEHLILPNNQFAAQDTQGGYKQE
jgi:hypothetical protein